MLIKKLYFQKVNKVEIFTIIIFIHLSIFIYLFENKNNDERIEYSHDELTIVSAYYKIKSKFKHSVYLDWIKNFIMLNKSMVIFTNNKFIPHLKKLRPKKFHNKTVFLELEMEDFYSYKNFYDKFKESFKIDFEKKYHTIPLYLIWAEKCNFMKIAIQNNYFRSKCFYWIDIGYFREQGDIDKYSNNWPSLKKCLGDKRLLMGQVNNFSSIEKEKILRFDFDAHIRLRKNYNVIGGIFGGQYENIFKFINLYYATLRLFIKNKMFIGKDQNIFTYIAFAHPEIIKLIYCKDFFEYRMHIS